MLVEVAIALAADVLADDTARCNFIGAIDVLHVGAHFGDIHRTVGIEGDGDGFFDLRFAEHEFERVTFGQLDGFEKPLGRKVRHLFLWREIKSGWHCL